MAYFGTRASGIAARSGARAARSVGAFRRSSGRRNLRAELHLVVAGVRAAQPQQLVVVEQGTHDELLRLGGTYARYYEMQFGPEVPSA